MSTQKTGYLEVPGFKGILETREDGAALKVGGVIYTLPTSAATLARTDAAQTLTGNQTIVGSQLTTSNVGTVTTAATTTAEEHGDGVWHITKLTMTAFAIGTSGDNENLRVGAKFYTWPSGTVILCESVSIAGGITAAVSNTAQTPEVGIGSVQGTTAAATLSTTTEDYVDGGAAGGTGDAATVAPDVAGGAFNKCNLSTVRPIVKASGGLSRDLYLNIAVAWADVTAAGAVTFTGTITLVWRIIG